MPIISVRDNENNRLKIKEKHTHTHTHKSKDRKEHFIFNSRFYNQIDGVVMGLSLAPVLANIFMSFYESKWLNEYNLNKPKSYLRYFNDVLAACDKEQDSLHI